jgi:ubiquinone/menaquinone biosynthesis C-methylase UbiE
MSESDKYWDKTAEKYAKSPVSDEATYQKKLAETQRFLTPDMRILEFGCGTGTTAVHHAPHVQHIDAIDISENMLEIARRNAAEAGVENISFTRGTLSEFNAESASLDAILGLNVLHLVADRQAVIAEVARVLKPGGIFVNSTVCLGNSYLRFIKLAIPLAKLAGLMPDLFILTEAELTDEITNEGFVIESQWHHAKNGIAVFIVARKV